MPVLEQSKSAMPSHERVLPVGAELARGGVSFRVWAPSRKTVEVVFTPAKISVLLERESDGFFSGFAEGAKAGDLYQFRLDGGDLLLPDPASRFQPQGPHGPSQIVDAQSFQWSDKSWNGVGAENQVLYEMHIGTFTPEGTWEAAARELPELAELGITCIEVMPVADFPGNFGWGYDGVNLFAPTRLYGRPDDFRRFIDRAHAVGVGVILDVVYNHLGPDGNYLKEFSPDFFSTRHKTDWGEAINFDGPNSSAVRQFYLANIRHWIQEYHLDGFRFDATQNMYDDSADHILAVITREARQSAGKKKVYLISENEPQHTRLVRPAARGGYGMDGLWNDDFHHSAVVRLTGRSEAYYTDYCGDPQEFISAAKWGYLFQGQRYKWQKGRRGMPGLDLPPSAYVHFIENHDQVANLVHGLRITNMTGVCELKTMTALLLLMPQTPMLFQGQEFGSSKPFVYFADHNPELAKLVRKGRAEFLSQFPSAALPEVRGVVPEPADRGTFEKCKLDLGERKTHSELYALHRDLLRLRRNDPVLRRHDRAALDGAVLGNDSLLLRFFGESGEDRLLVLNFGKDLNFDPAPEPLLAPPMDSRWDILWSSEDPRYGGSGTVPPDGEQNWKLPGRSAILLKPVADKASHAGPEGQP